MIGKVGKYTRRHGWRRSRAASGTAAEGSNRSRHSCLSRHLCILASRRRSSYTRDAMDGGGRAASGNSRRETARPLPTFLSFAALVHPYVAGSSCRRTKMGGYETPRIRRLAVIYRSGWSRACLRLRRRREPRIPRGATTSPPWRRRATATSRAQAVSAAARRLCTARLRRIRTAQGPSGADPAGQDSCFSRGKTATRPSVTSSARNGCASWQVKASGRRSCARYQDVENDPELQCQRLTQLLRPERATPPAPADGRDRETLAHRQTAARGVRCGVRGVEKVRPLTSEKVWERIRLAMENGQLGLAGDLARYLDYSERAWVTRWQAMHRDPPRELDRLHYPVETPVARGIVRHGIVRMARRDPEAAMQQWQKLKSRHRFLGEDENYVLRHLGIAAAQNHLPVALTWLANVSADASDETLHLWRVRAALRAGDWEAARGFVAGLTEAQRRQPQWRYWSARVLEASGHQGDDSRDGGGRATQGSSCRGTAAVRRTCAQPRLLRFPRRRPAGRGTTRCSTLPSTLTRRSFRFCSCARACRWRRNCTPSARPWTRAGSGTGARATSATANCRWQR